MRAGGPLPSRGRWMAFDWLDDDRQPLQFIISVSEVAIAGLMLLLMLSVWVYVLVRARRRGGGKLYLPRASLGMLGILWMLAVFFSHVALWDVLGAADVVGVEVSRKIYVMNVQSAHVPNHGSHKKRAMVFYYLR